MVRRSNLGRGLEALFGPEVEAGREEDVRTLPIERLSPNPYQPRRRFADAEMDNLVASVREKGVLQPLLVRPVGGPDDAAAAERAYQIVAGERRWRAAQQVGLHEVPVVVRALSDLEALQVALIENVQRQDLTAIEEAEGYDRLVREFGYTQDTLGRAVGKSRSHIANTLRLLDLPADVRMLVQDSRLSAGHARALLTLPDPGAAARTVLERGLNVRQTEALAREAQAPARAERAPAKTPSGKDADILALEHELAQVLGLRVQIRPSPDPSRGDLVVQYRSLEQLDDLCRRLSGTDL